jgi:hypothetical protein
MNSIFEEHRLCPSAGQLRSEPFASAPGVYVVEDNTFVFHNVVAAGGGVRARFRLTNTGLVPCQLLLAIKQGTTKVPRLVHPA